MPRTKQRPLNPPASEKAAPNGIGETPEVLTLEEAASYFRVPADVVLRMIDAEGDFRRARFPVRTGGSTRLRSRLGWEQRDPREVSLTISGGSRTIPTLRRCLRKFTPGDGDLGQSTNDALPRYGHDDPRPLGPSQGRV